MRIPHLTDRTRRGSRALAAWSDQPVRYFRLPSVFEFAGALGRPWFGNEAIFDLVARSPARRETDGSTWTSASARESAT
jgi:hypothetical protein